jgi:hypothetical protein
MIDRDTLARIAEESAERLAEIGVRSGDRSWIERHAETVASLGRVSRSRRSLREALYRLARRAARTAR